MKQLIINADDYGRSDFFDRGIIEAMMQGMVTSTSVMVLRCSAEAAQMLNDVDISVGLHLELAEGDAAPQIREQDKRFKQLFNCSPTHVDGHKDAHIRDDETKQAVADYAKSLSIPVRAHYEFDRKFFRGQGLKTADNIQLLLRRNAFQIVQSVSELKEGVTEWVAHPGYTDPNSDSTLNAEREEELKILLSMELKAALEKNDVYLIDFREL
ncbi:ChbG/HpnK family deacetylase [Candidatus Micrarchaeota archaeon]|nr:ChbG/HpnK family deacetylase [Candidatus Micrarchaeota archaeon]